MLHEFAVEPLAFGDLRDARFLCESFGFEHGRLISAYPTSWQEAVLEAAGELSYTDRSRLQILLGRCKRKMFPTRRLYESTLSWIQNASHEHAKVPFRAVLIKESGHSATHIVGLDGLDETCESWMVPRGIAIEKTLRSLAACVLPIVKCSREVLLVDPYFSPSGRKWIELVVKIASLFEQARIAPVRFEFHLSAERTPTRPVPSTDEFIRALREPDRRQLAFVNRVPRGLEIEFVRWKQLLQGERLHDRFILTDRGGIEVPGGLDGGEPGETTDVLLLPEALYLKRWNQYQIDASTAKQEYEGQVFTRTFQLHDRIQVVGRKSVRVL